MKKVIAICLLLILVFVLCYPKVGYADPMTISQIASLSYALGSSFGIDFSMSGITAAGANTYFQNEINKYIGESTIIEKFGTEAARIVAGKLIIPHLLYNGIKEFLQKFVSDNKLDTELKELVYQDQGNRIEVLPMNVNSVGFLGAQWRITNLSTGESQVLIANWYSPSWNPRNGGISVTDGKVYGIYIDNVNGTRYKFLTDVVGTSFSQVSSSMTGEIPDIVLNPDKEWSGTIGGEDWPDTNLDQLLGNIDQEVIDGTLEVEGEIVDPVVPPTPAPTPAPIEPDTPLQDVPWEGLNDLIGQSTGETVDSINQGVQDITGALEDVQEGVSSIEGTLEDAFATPGSEDLPEFKFDLRELFPFCIPFDIYRLLSSFDATPLAPHVQIPIVIQSIGFSYTMDLDFSIFDPVAQALRTAELIVYAIGLAWATGKVIKW